MAKRLWPTRKKTSRETWIDWEESWGLFRDPHELIVIRKPAGPRLWRGVNYPRGIPWGCVDQRLPSIAMESETPFAVVLIRLRTIDLFYGDIDPDWIDKVVSRSGPYDTYAQACDALTNPRYSTYSQVVVDGFAHIDAKYAEREAA